MSNKPTDEETKKFVLDCKLFVENATELLSTGSRLIEFSRQFNDYLNEDDAPKTAFGVAYQIHFFTSLLLKKQLDNSLREYQDLVKDLTIDEIKATIRNLESVLKGEN